MIRGVKSGSECIGCGACEQKCPQVFRIRYRPYSEAVKTDFDKYANTMLDAYYACPVQAIEVEGEHPKLKSAWRGARIVQKTLLTAKVMEIRIETGDLQFRPGQYITLRLKDYLGTFNRAYSVADVRDGCATLCVTLLSNGRAGNFFRSCTVPCDIEITAARGEFKVETPDRPKVFLATGTGLIPILAMIESCPDAKKILYFGQRDSTELFYLDRLAKVPNLEVKVCLDFAEESWTGYRGRVTDRLAEDGLQPGTEVYACGSDGMMMGVRQVLEQKRHELDKYFFESFTGKLAGQEEQGLNWRQWVRNVHFYASLLLSGLFLFFGLTGFLASRPELFHSESGRHLPPNIKIEQAELAGYLKSQLPPDAQFSTFTQADDQVTLQFAGAGGTKYNVDLSVAERSYNIAERHPFPPDKPLSDLPALAAHIAKAYPGTFAKESIEKDGDLVFFNIESVWSQTTVTIDKASMTYQVTQQKSPWASALTDLHRGKKASKGQRLLIDLTAIVMVIVTISGIVFGLQSRNPKVRITALILVVISFILAATMAINR